MNWSVVSTHTTEGCTYWALLRWLTLLWINICHVVFSCLFVVSSVQLSGSLTNTTATSLSTTQHCSTCPSRSYQRRCLASKSTLLEKVRVELLRVHLHMFPNLPRRLHPFCRLCLFPSWVLSIPCNVYFCLSLSLPFLAIFPFVWPFLACWPHHAPISLLFVKVQYQSWAFPLGLCHWLRRSCIDWQTTAPIIQPASRGPWSQLQRGGGTIPTTSTTMKRRRWSAASASARPGVCVCVRYVCITWGLAFWGQC